MSSAGYAGRCGRDAAGIFSNTCIDCGQHATSLATSRKVNRDQHATSLATSRKGSRQVRDESLIIIMKNKGNGLTMTKYNIPTAPEALQKPISCQMLESYKRFNQRWTRGADSQHNGNPQDEIEPTIPE